MNRDSTWTEPTRIRLEAAAVCQLKCPSCPTASGMIRPEIAQGFLRAADFRTLLEHNPTLQEVELSNYGEMLLNPQLLEILETAHEHGVRLTASNGVNFNHVRDEVLEGLVRYRMHAITVSIDGVTQATYEQYRVGGDLERVLQHLRRLNELKRVHHSEFPQLTMQFIVFGHNEGEIAQARELATSLGMKFFPKLSWDPHFSPIRDVQAVRAAIGVADRDEYRDKHGEEYLIESCHQLWDHPQINWDGKILGCCRNFWGDFGQAPVDQSLSQTLNNGKLVAARAMLLGKNQVCDDIPCASCDVYLRMKESGKWLRREAPEVAVASPVEMA